MNSSRDATLDRFQIESLRTNLKSAASNLWMEGSTRVILHERIDALCNMALSAVSEKEGPVDRNAIIELCDRVCTGELLLDPQNADDEAYQRGVQDCRKAILALKNPAPQASPASEHSLCRDSVAGPAAAGPAHTNHPLRHFDRTCPACLAEFADAEERESAPSAIQGTPRCCDCEEPELCPCQHPDQHCMYCCKPMSSTQLRQWAQRSASEETLLDARRWRALLGCARIRILGHAGFDGDQGDYRHIGLEIWTQHPSHTIPPAKLLLTEFADCAERENVSSPDRTAKP